ncbi:MAG: hypothetical protein FWG68_05910 [Defluviitaleaceae bacterium]|nr:hypothetical protein [Defluviitaleaceae bacterium]
MTVWDIAILVFIIVVVVGVVLFLLNRWAGKRLVEQQTLINQNKQTMSIYVIDKKKDKIQNANFPKAVQEQVPRWNKLMKTNLVKAKIGPQIMTLLCDKDVFDALPVKKTVKVDLAGVYIVTMKGMKTKEQMKAIRKEKQNADATPWYRRLLNRQS